MGEKDTGEKKPFYENIVSSRRGRARSDSAGGKRVERSPQGRSASRADDGRQSSGERHPAKSHGPVNSGSGENSGERFGPRAGSHESSRHTPRESSDSRRPRDAGGSGYAGRPRESNDSRRGRDGADARRPRDVRTGERGSRGYAPPSSERTASRDHPLRENSSRPRKAFVEPAEFAPVFGSLSKETRTLLEVFPEIVQGVFPLDSKKIQQLPSQIRELSHGLTDERGDRRVGYMNDPAVMTAYVHYYMWWNLVRLTHIFSSLPLELSDGDGAVDLGSGPLTLPIALWMARPDLRKKKISWYCVDISQGALSAGEELFLSLAAKTGDEPWQITRVKGECGVSLRRRVRLVACANMFNELFWDNPLPPEALAKQYARDLSSYAEPDSSILVIEPGVPRSGHFVSLLRDSLMRLDFHPIAPCPHEGACPFPGNRNGKWCHFVLDTSIAPAKLHKLSDDAGLVKERATLSFILMERKPLAGENASIAEAQAADPSVAAEPAELRKSTEIVSDLARLFTGLRVRITSDTIKLPDYHIGRYGCSELGMVLVTGTFKASDYLRGCESGSLIEVPMPDRRHPERDGKTGAIIVRL